MLDMNAKSDSLTHVMANSLWKCPRRTRRALSLVKSLTASDYQTLGKLIGFLHKASQLVNTIHRKYHLNQQFLLASPSFPPFCDISLFSVTAYFCILLSQFTVHFA